MTETVQEKSEKFDSYLNSAYGDLGKTFKSLAEASAFAFNKPHAKITRLMKGIEINKPESTQGLHKVVKHYKGDNNVQAFTIHWFERVPSGKYLVSLA